MTGSGMACSELESLAAELALGTVSGAERASALAHLAGCPACRSLVEQLSLAADRLVLLAPASEPPPGFESRVLSRLGVGARAEPATVAPVPTAVAGRPGGRRRMLVAVAAAAMVAGLSGLAGATVFRDGAPPPARGDAAVRTALARDDGGRWSCRAVVYGDGPTWLVVSLDRSDGLDASFSVEALRSGSHEAVHVGTLAIQAGHGSMATVVGLRPEHVDAVRVRDAGGRVRYTVDFPAT